MKSRKSPGIQAGVKRDFIIWLKTVKIGAFPVKEHGEYLFLFSMVRMRHQLLRTKPLNMYLIYSVNMVQIFGLSGMQKIYYLKALLLNLVLSENLPMIR